MDTHNELEQIYLSPPDVGDDERASILRAFDSGWIAPVGAELDGFETELASYVERPAAVAVSSGSAALRLALALYDVGPGDEVVVATATFAASAFVVDHAGATPVFCDAEADSWCLDPELLAEFLAERAKVGRLPKAVMPVSLYGSAPNYERLAQVCGEYDVAIIEDAAEALGSQADGRPVGHRDHVAIFSFNGNKIITSSSGGAFVGTQEQADRIRYLATQARVPVMHYEHVDIGFNFRMSNLLAALGRAQLGRLESLITRRTEINLAYRAAFPDFDWCPYRFTSRPNHWLSVALLPDPLDPFELSAKLGEAKIEARPAWKPMHLQPVFAQAEMVGSGAVSEHLFDRGFCLPSGSTLTDQAVERVVATVHACIS